MRLTEQQRAIIRAAVMEIFGADAKVWLFGSRVDDHQRGGDIDLLIKSQTGDAMNVMRAEINLQTILQAKLGEQKIDILLDYPSRLTYPPIFQVAKQTGVVL
ncbi:MAG: nucleotidyltransferase domain-containing protein [Betaproteobacteria bacterium]|nr:nucleotidyltransferase domain-containing protein [Betaproteobacteria bacterium]